MAQDLGSISSGWGYGVTVYSSYAIMHDKPKQPVKRQDEALTILELLELCPSDLANEVWSKAIITCLSKRYCAMAGDILNKHPIQLSESDEESVVSLAFETTSLEVLLFIRDRLGITDLFERENADGLLLLDELIDAFYHKLKSGRYDYESNEKPDTSEQDKKLQKAQENVVESLRYVMENT